MTGFRNDVQHAIRLLAKQAGFTVVASLTLAVSIAATTTIFGIVNGVMLRPLPFANPDRLTQIWETTPQGGTHSVSQPDFLDFAHSRAFESVGAYSPIDLALTGRGEPVQLHGISASRSLFSVLGVQPALGRGFSIAEDAPGDSSRIVILSHAVWSSRLGGDRSAIGRLLTLGGRQYTVIGVMPLGFHIPQADIYVPLQANPNSDRHDHWLRLIGRLRAGQTPASAQADLARIAGQIEAIDPRSKGWSAQVKPLLDELVDTSFRRAGWVMLAATGLLLLLACANVANLLLARATTRQTEMGVRTAIGAGRGRLVRQLLTESLVLVTPAGVLGVIGAVWGIAAVRTFGAGYVPRLEDIVIDARVIIAAIALTGVTVIACGLVPALRTSGVAPASVLGDSARGGISRRHRRTRDALVIMQIALSIVLLVGAGLLIRSFSRLSNERLGYEAEHVLAVELSLPEQRYDEMLRVMFFNQLSASLSALPGVRSAGATAVNPLTGWNYANAVTPEDRVATTPPSGFMQASWRSVTPEFFATLGVSLIRGRVFSSSDAWNGPKIAIVSRLLADRLWPGEDAVGKRIFWGGTTGTPRTIVGVVGDIRDVEPQTASDPMLFVPYNQVPMPTMTLVVRTEGPAAALAGAVRGAIRALDRDLPIPDLHVLSRNREDAMASQRLRLMLMSIFALLAAALASSGVYAAIAFNVAHRRREIGIRLALGAVPASVIAVFMRSGAAITFVGAFVGLAVAWPLTRLMRGLLYGIEPTDALTFSTVAIALGAVAMLASYLAARRAASVSPVDALRQ